MKLCNQQEDCKDFKCGRLPPNHHVRATEKCDLFVDGECSLLDGQSCEISKGKLSKKLKEVK